MFERISRGLELTGQSLRVLREEKSLIVFPALSGLACLAVVASFIAPLWNNQLFQGFMKHPKEALQNPLVLAGLFLFYFINYFVIVFFNSALVSCAIIRFKGGDPTLGDGLHTAMNRLPQIAGWALVSATIGVILKVIESYSEKVGQIVAGLLGAAWGIATYFVVPVLVVERVGPIDAVKRSFAVIRKAWGESLTAHFSIQFVVFFATMAALIPAVIGIVAGTALAATIGIAVTVALVILISLVSAATHSIILAAVYLYAAEGTVPSQFNESSLKGAFGPKKSR